MYKLLLLLYSVPEKIKNIKISPLIIFKNSKNQCMNKLILGTKNFTLNMLVEMNTVDF